MKLDKIIKWSFITFLISGFIAFSLFDSNYPWIGGVAFVALVSLIVLLFSVNIKLDKKNRDLFTDKDD